LLRDFIAKKGPWAGTASDLLGALATLGGEKVVKQTSWPKNGRALSNTLRHLAPTLRAVGVAVEFGDRSGKKGSRILRLSVSEQAREQGTV
jgi:hypothetical protein